MPDERDAFIFIDNTMNGSEYELGIPFIGGDIDIEVFHSDFCVHIMIKREKYKRENTFDYFDFCSTIPEILTPPPMMRQPFRYELPREVDIN